MGENVEMVPLLVDDENKSEAELDETVPFVMLGEFVEVAGR